jgi:hypothetical protein
MGMLKGHQAEVEKPGTNQKRHLSGSIHWRIGQVFVTEAAPKQGRNAQGLRINLGCLGAPGMSDLPLLSSLASRESDGFCTIDHQENSTSSETSTP